MKTYQLPELSKILNMHSSRALRFLESRGIKPLKTVVLQPSGYHFRTYGKNAYDLAMKMKLYHAAKAAGRIPTSMAFVPMEEALSWLEEQDAQPSISTQEAPPSPTLQAVAEAATTLTVSEDKALPEMTFEIIKDPDSLRSLVKNVQTELADIKAMLTVIQRELSGVVSVPTFDDEAGARARSNGNGAARN